MTGGLTCAGAYVDEARLLPRDFVITGYDHPLLAARHTQQITDVAGDVDPNAIPGDCLRAAVASLTGEPVDAVPHFALYRYWWWDVLRAWARTRGLDFACVELVDGSIRHALADPDWPADTAGLLIGVGPSPRGGRVTHAVVVDIDLALVHDPHPSRAGLVKVVEAYAIVAPYECDDDPLLPLILPGE